MIYTVLNILFLHIIFKTIIQNIISEIDLNDSNILQIFKDKIIERYNRIDMQISEKILEEIIKISIKICSIKKFEFESILYFIREAEKNFISTNNTNFEDRILQNLKTLDFYLSEENRTLNINPDNKQENMSFPLVQNLLISQIEKNDEKISIKNENILGKLVKETNILSTLDSQQGLIVIYF